MVKKSEARFPGSFRFATFRIPMPSAPGTVTTTQLAELLLLSERRIQQLTRAGVLKHAYDEQDGHELRGRFRWVEAIQAYIRYLRQEFGSEDVTETKFLDARSRRMIAVAEAAELQLAVLKGKLHRTEDVEFIMTNRDSAIRARLLAIPARVGRLLVGQTDLNEIRDLLNAESYSALNSLVAYDPSVFSEQNEEYLAHLFSAPAAKLADSNGGNGDLASDDEPE
jgi:phage terminase Nu1 subunit (DNA packaging protein)